MANSATTILLLLLLPLLPFCTSPATASAVSLSVSPTVLSKSGDPIRIQWSGVDTPSSLDWLGIYSPPDSANDHFIGYIFLSTSPTHITSGSGSVSLPLPNLRSNYTFRIFRWSQTEIDPSRLDHDHNPLPGTKHLLASSVAVGFQPGRGPEQLHLSYTDYEDEMRVMFVAEDDGERLVRYGRRENKLDKVAAARVERYEREDMCDSPANTSVGWRDPGWIHGAVMKNLKNGIKYYYQVNNEKFRLTNCQNSSRRLLMHVQLPIKIAPFLILITVYAYPLLRSTIIIR